MRKSHPMVVKFCDIKSNMVIVIFLSGLYCQKNSVYTYSDLNQKSRTVSLHQPIGQ